MNQKKITKSAALQIRMTEEEKEKIRKNAMKFGMNMSEYITFCALNFELNQNMTQISDKLDKIWEFMNVSHEDKS